MHGYVTRAATLVDAPAAVELLRDSITRLCVVDHQNDPATLERWLQNKTVGHLERWISDAANYVVVAELDAVLLGIALLTASGNLHLCYVCPGRTRAGAGSAMLGRLEAQAIAWGLAELRLTSTANARPFYERHGYEPAGNSRIAFGVLREYPYRKSLRGADRAHR